MFSNAFDAAAVRDLLTRPVLPTERALEILQTSAALNLKDLAALLLSASRDESIRSKIVTAAQKRRRENWEQKLFLMPPLYISDGDLSRGGCLDHCLYCPWRNGNVPVERLQHLNTASITAEAQLLIRKGYGDIELVAATDPRLLKSEGAAETVAAARSAGAHHIGINFFPLRQVSDYRAVVDAGCTFAIVWQETYQEDVYAKMHPRGPKANIEYRLDAHDRALQGGVLTVGLAFLGGLADWRFDALATIAHALYLQHEYSSNVIFGMPRWKHGDGIPLQTAPDFFGDAEFELVGALYSLAIPGSLPWFSTREHFELSARAARGGGCIFTLDCSTEVGGYSKSGGFAQFPVYSRSFSDGVVWLRNLDFDPQVHLPW